MEAGDLSPAVLTPAALSPEDERAHALATGQGYGDEVSVNDGSADEVGAESGVPTWGDGLMGDEPVTEDAVFGGDVEPVESVEVESDVTGDEVTATVPEADNTGGSEPVSDAQVDEQVGEASLEDTWTEADEAAAASPAAGHIAGDSSHGAGDSGDWQYDEAREGQGSADDHAEHEVEAAWGRRISDLDEVSDGGFGVGSAAPIADGAQPLGHTVQAYRDTMTYRTQDAPGYDSCEPDVWFYDEDSARRAGFNPAQHG